jgi:DNA-binding XRE family transcriptional regulator
MLVSSSQINLFKYINIAGMGKPTLVPLPHRQALNKALVFLKDAPAAVRQPPHVYVRALRVALRMSQADLGRRAGLAQSHVAAIESGRTDVGVATLRRLFDAMFCDLLVVPRARQRPSEALAERELENERKPPPRRGRRPLWAG